MLSACRSSRPGRLRSRTHAANRPASISRFRSGIAGRCRQCARTAPFLDIAYQGFAEGLDADAVAVRRFAAACKVVLVSSSFSKSLSLYGERVGALSIVAENAAEAARTLSQLKRAIRTNYSNPPSHGGQAVATVLTTPELRTLWENELGQMRERIKTMRHQLVDKVRAIRADFD
jgi:aromatic-amino-acid transaminase